MIGIGIAFILGMLFGAYIASPILRKKVNAFLKKQGTPAKPNICKACKGTGFLLAQDGKQIKCSYCNGMGRTNAQG